MRVLVILTPLMYREAIAHFLRQHRPALEVRMAAPEVAQEVLTRIIHERSGELRFARPKTDEMPLKSR